MRIKRSLALFLAGVLCAFLLDPANGGKRRARVGSWLAPMGRRVQGATEGLAGTGMGQKIAASPAPRIIDSLQRVALRLQGRIVEPIEPAGAPDEQPVPATGQARGPAHAPVAAPRPVPDALPEGDAHDPTPVARVDSQRQLSN